MGSLIYALVVLLVDGVSELPMTAERHSVSYGQKDLRYYPAWPYAIPATILKVPILCWISHLNLSYSLCHWKQPATIEVSLIHLIKLQYINYNVTSHQFLWHFSCFFVVVGSYTSSFYVCCSFHIIIYVPISGILLSKRGCFYHSQ